jgi:hypothetical protein
MSRLTEPNPTARELVTEILDGVLWWGTLKVIVQFLDAKNVQQVRVEFGFVWIVVSKENRRVNIKLSN